MMNNLFSMFDPSSSYMSMSWFSIFIPILMMTQNKSIITTKWSNLMNSIMSPIFKEMKPLLGSSMKKGITPLLVSMFVIIIIMNLMAMSPFTFTPTAHIIMSFTFAMVIWMAMMMYGWINNTKNMMAHTVPSGTPIMLLNFMVMIELVSNIIRPITLSIRLSANMVAGHLLMSLLGSFALMSTTNMMLSATVILMLTMLETGVAMIQAYVFMTLMTLYSTEIH